MLDEPYCPKCGASRMVKRTNKDTGKEFYGCKNYPDCKGTVAIDSRGKAEQGNDWSFLKKA